MNDNEQLDPETDAAFDDFLRDDPEVQSVLSDMAEEKLAREAWDDICSEAAIGGDRTSVEIIIEAIRKAKREVRASTGGTSLQSIENVWDEAIAIALSVGADSIAKMLGQAKIKSIAVALSVPSEFAEVRAQVDKLINSDFVCSRCGSDKKGKSSTGGTAIEKLAREDKKSVNAEQTSQLNRARSERQLT